MKRKLSNLFCIGQLAAATVVCAIIATPAQACPGAQPPRSPATLAASAAALARLGFHRPQAADTNGNGNPLPAVSDPDPTGSIVGLWQVTLSAGGQVIGQAWEVFHSDGTELTIDTTPPSLDNVCVGVWTQTGTFTYRLKHPSWIFDEAGNLIGTAIIRTTMTVDRTAAKFTGTTTVDIFDNSGRLLQHFDATVAATRIRPD